MVEFEDSRGEKTTECTGKRSHDDVEGETKCEFAPAIPAGHVVCNSRHHTGFEHPEKETNCGGGVDIIHERSADRADAKTEGKGGDIPPRTDPLASHVGGNFEENIGDIEDGEDFIVIVTFEAEIFFESGDLRIT
jgi:hypothetical protein